MQIGDKITTKNLGELFITTAVSLLIGSSAPPTPLNSIWWATFDAAMNLAARYGGKVVQAPPYYPSVWWRTLFNPGTMNYIVIGNAEINAGELAQTFVHNPEDTSPGTADRINKQLIAMYQMG